MVKGQTTVLAVLGAVMLVGVSSPGSAADCFQVSPALGVAGESYYEIPASSRLSEDQRRALQRFGDRLAGTWPDGSGRQVECLGSEADPEVREREIESELAVSFPGGETLRIEEERFVKQEGRRSQEVVELFGPRSNAQLDRLDDTRLVAIEKYRRRHGFGGQRGSSLWEIVHDLQLSGGRLDYTTTRYANGYLVSRDSRQYQRNPYLRQR